MLRWDLFEGGDSSKEVVNTYDHKGHVTSTISLIWRMTNPLWVTGKKVVMESGFCVLRRFIGIFERGVYISSLVNNNRYIPTRMY